ncbi:HD domain-containing phosphohydrolase [Desulfurivibrio alkaliphilus]|uniref:Response regulator receiver modulated metal dependent phosphohydrolase n=1 Tax=Desulfurivibrio alkaliphilus (strain DSM 19089 / UNIQEM U267 / AHT2) TaxID=589865 RepID=D6Z6N8_DESAT|nr:HD domain-containing phosphohydrolase [Desulfurivibrio alkaliphilus]ADH84997.1 response regulator receiver modulated metal dependent phosphohydrolase [Desulfurivibrio alkaliphilus AHT 2]
MIDKQQQPAAAGGPKEAAGGFVLFVDDEDNILRALRRLFQEEKFEVVTATSGEEALEIISRRDDCAVIVSDQRMPGLSGVETLARVRKQAPLILRLLLTGYADIEAAMDSINRGGVFRYITKPWQDEELLQTVRHAHQHHHLVKENLRLSELVKKQNEELKRWNSELENMVQEQTEELQRSYDELKAFNSRLRANFKSVITALAGLMELRNKRMRSHSQNVAEIAARVGSELKLAVAERENLVVAALLHDIGKLGMPDVMLLVDPFQMDEAEMEEYQKHPVRGQVALDRIEDLREAARIIRHHHEHYDGGGFPDGLKQREIPQAARIIALIDFIDQETRRYQGSSGLSIAFKKAREGAGSRFDPRLIAPVEKVARRFYRRRLPKVEFVEMELQPKDLAAGMTLSRDFFSGTGILLLSKGTVLTEANLSILRRYAQLDPTKRGVFVSIKDDGDEEGEGEDGGNGAEA